MVARRAVQGACTGLRRYLPSASRRASRPICANGLFAHLQRLSLRLHDQAQTGQLMARANSDIQQIQFFLVFIPLFMRQRGDRCRGRQWCCSSATPVLPWLAALEAPPG